ncbi:MAG: hypothetical protein HY602_01360 [Parcubacteria group bacterium]|nr:hypothetical protein [Parcubacteria group bacterium]
MNTLDVQQAHLMGTWESWRENPASPEDSYFLLAGMGFFRRLGDSEQNPMRFALPGMEVFLRSNLKTALEAFGKFMDKSTLPERVCEGLGDADIVAFYHDRDAAELALQMAVHCVDQQFHSGFMAVPNFSILGKVRRILDEVDDLILFSPSIIEKMRELGALEPAVRYDADFFWWLPSDRDNRCWLPGRRCWDYISGYMENRLSVRIRDLFQKHLQNCVLCDDLLAMVKVSRYY